MREEESEHCGKTRRSAAPDPPASRFRVALWRPEQQGRGHRSAHPRASLQEPPAWLWESFSEPRTGAEGLWQGGRGKDGRRVEAAKAILFRS